MLIQEYRASKILYNFLVSNNFGGTFLIPANSCPVVPLVFLKAETKFELIDISLSEFCIDQQSVMDKIKRQPGMYSGILYVRTYGVENDVDFFFRELKSLDNGFIIIDDCCLCKPDLSNEKDDLIDLKLFSTGYAKYIDIGMGGFAYLNESKSFKYQPTFKKYCQTDYEILMSSVKNAIQSNLTFIYDKQLKWLDNLEMPSDYLRTVEEKLPAIIEHKNKLNVIYKDNLPPSVILDDKFQHWRFNIMVDPAKKEHLISKIFKNGLFASSHYYPLTHIFHQVQSPNAEYIKQRVVNLFNDMYYTEDQAYKTCTIINEYL
jgi:dTDP-4-amino-4,6-dideoxygalactose transaminase